MERFARLYAELDARTATTHKVDALKRYFADAPPADAAWAVYFLAGGKPRQTVPNALLRLAAVREAGIPDWLFEECYQAVGDFAETVSLVLPESAATSAVGLAEWLELRLLPLRGQPPEVVVDSLAQWWMELDNAGRFLLVKLIGGGFRVGVSKLLVQRALAEHAGLDPKLVAQRMMGYTDGRSAPTAERYLALVAQDEHPGADAGRPYPFFLAHAVDGEAADFDRLLGPPSQWLVEWKYDGIRAQIVKREGQVWVWSRGEELVSGRFPEVEVLAGELPDGTVLDGELLAWNAAAAAGIGEGKGGPAPFALLQQRIGRKTLTKRVLADAPVAFVAYDILEWQGSDRRSLPQHERRALLESTLAGHPGLHVSPLVQADDWPGYAALRNESRSRAVEGFMLKQRDAQYGVGRTKASGTWWKWKIEPMTADAVLVYAQAGHGRRASVYTDYTFAVWNRTPRDAAEAHAVIEAITRREPPPEGGLQLVPFAKAYSGLTDAEFAEVDRLIRASTLEKFGPVRSVRPSLVFELGFEGIQRSSRHKSGIAVRFPRMLRIRHDKPLHEADTLRSLEALITATGPRSDGG
jgi:DNA ligase-1